MADRLSLRIVTAPVEREMASIQRRMNRAAMYSVREVARQIKREARKIAPVYQGDDPTIVRSLYRDGIRSSRQLKQPEPGTYRVAIGPRGPRVHLYAQKLEDNVIPTMHRAYQAVEPRMREIYERVANRVLSKP